MAQTLTDEDLELVAMRVCELQAQALLNVCGKQAPRSAPTLRSVYTVEQFAKEILCGYRHPNWVRDQIKAKKIRAVTTRPYLIGVGEVRRFLGNPP